MSAETRDDGSVLREEGAVPRRDFLRQSVATAGAIGAVVASEGPVAALGAGAVEPGGRLTGARYDAVEKVPYLKPAIKGDFRAFLSTATGYGTVGVRNGKPFLDVRQGRIDVRRIEN